MRRLVWAVLLLGAGALGGEASGEPTAEEVRWIRDLIRALGANSPQVRQGAEQALATMGLDALGTIVEYQGEAKGRAAREGLLRVLGAIGGEAVLRALESMREGARGGEARRIEELIVDLRGSNAPGTTSTLPLAPSTDVRADALPLAVTIEVADGRLPATVAGRALAAREGPRGLEVDTDGEGTPDVSAPFDRSTVLQVGPAGAQRPIVVRRLRGRWFVSPAGCLRGGSGETAVEILDGDQDGEFSGDRDWIRWQEGGFAPMAGERLLALGTGLAKYQVRRGTAGWEIVLEPQPSATNADPAAQRCLGALNRARGELGLAPVRLDLERSRRCDRHAQYLLRHGSTAEAEGVSAHREDPARAGFSPEGAEAGANSVIHGSGDGGRAVDSFLSTMLHRVALLGPPRSEGYGIGCAGGAKGWTLVWGEDARAHADGTPLVVPAPGQPAVPTHLRGEIPPPDDPPGYYEGRHGYAVSAHYGGREWRDVDLRLFVGESGLAVPGRLWSHEKPVTALDPSNAHTVFFAPEEPLQAQTLYTVELEATEGGRRRLWAWSFTTR